MRKRLVANLSHELESDVELGALRLRVLPTLHAEGSDLMIRHKNHRDEPPLISIESFSADAGLLGLVRNHAGRVELVGLDIQIPPDYKDSHGSPDDRPDGSRDKESPNANRSNNGAQNPDKGYRDVIVDTLVANGVLALPSLEFRIPGAVVQLAGGLALRAETLDFLGTVLMDAKLSETVTGFKSLLLKVVDPLFGKKGGGSAIPIKVGGTVDEPALGLDVGRVFKRDKTF